MSKNCRITAKEVCNKMRPNSGAVAMEVRCVVDFAEGLLRSGDLPGSFSVGCWGGLVWCRALFRFVLVSALEWWYGYAQRKCCPNGFAFGHGLAIGRWGKWGGVRHDEMCFIARFGLLWGLPGLFVRINGLEPLRLSPPDPKSGAATNYAISACVSALTVCFACCCFVCKDTIFF